MRALAKATPYLKNERYYTGDVEEDENMRKAIADLLNVIELVSHISHIFRLY